jgi:hypothetical protein
VSKDLLGHVSAIQHSENKASHVHLELCGCKIEPDQDLNFKLDIHIRVSKVVVDHNDLLSQ